MIGAAHFQEQMPPILAHEWKHRKYAWVMVPRIWSEVCRFEFREVTCPWVVPQKDMGFLWIFAVSNRQFANFEPTLNQPTGLFKDV